MNAHSCVTKLTWRVPQRCTGLCCSLDAGEPGLSLNSNSGATSSHDGQCPWGAGRLPGSDPNVCPPVLDATWWLLSYRLSTPYTAGEIFIHERYYIGFQTILNSIRLRGNNTNKKFRVYKSTVYNNNKTHEGGGWHCFWLVCNWKQHRPGVRECEATRRRGSSSGGMWPTGLALDTWVSKRFVCHGRPHKKRLHHQNKDNTSFFLTSKRETVTLLIQVG